MNLDKAWLADFLAHPNNLKAVVSRFEGELETLKNKKKGAAKKNKDKLTLITSKLNQVKHIRERAEELQISMDYLEGGSIKYLKNFSKALFSNPDEEANRNRLLEEIDSLID